MAYQNSHILSQTHVSICSIFSVNTLNSDKVIDSLKGLIITSCVKTKKYHTQIIFSSLENLVFALARLRPCIPLMCIIMSIIHFDDYCPKMDGSQIQSISVV